jgi:hypothetical protein
MKSRKVSSKPTLHTEALMRVRMAMPSLKLADNRPLPDKQANADQIYIEQLLELGFIYSHEIVVDNPVGKQEGEVSSIYVYMHVEQCIYALLTDLFHCNSWVYFTNYYTQGQRIVTSSQPGSLQLEPLQNNTDLDDLFIQNAGSSALDSQWKRHRRLAATWLPNENSLLLQPDQHLSIERGFYLRYVQHLMQGNVLRQTDTQTFRFTRSGARSFHAAITSRSARRPQPKVDQWIGNNGKLPVKSLLKNNKTYAGLGLAAAIAGAVAIVPGFTGKQIELPGGVVKQPADATASNAEYSAAPTLAGNNHEALDDELLATVAAGAISGYSDKAGNNASTTNVDRSAVINGENIDTNATNEAAETSLPALPPAPNTETVQLIAASTEDEMWRIAVENAEFYLMSNDGDPAPWIRTARKIAAGFRSDDGRLARTYFLAALLESDYRIAEQQYNRALSIQTKTLGLYHPETAQTLEALAWVAERNKDSLEEAITHQRLAVNIYRDIYGADAEDTKAALWKLEYFEDRLAGVKPRIDENRRLLPALARFGN